MYRIMIVDDEKIIRDGIARVLPWKEMGIGEVYTAASGLEALEIVEKNVDCIYRQFMEENTRGFPGHPEIEQALLRLYRITGKEKYRELSQHFVDVRG